MNRRALSRAALVAAAVLAPGAGVGTVAEAAAPTPTLQDYKYFRALSADLLGRVPTRAELAAFEQPGFSIDKWLDAHLQGSDYADRMTRIYADLLRPQLSTQFRYPSTRNFLASVTYKAPDGKLVRLFYRPGQLRKRTQDLRTTLAADATYKQCAAIRDPINDPNYGTLGCAKYEKYDNLLKAGMCLQADELGLRHSGGVLAPTPFPEQPGDKPGDPPRAAAVQAQLDKYTKVVRPWWLYADFRAATPTQRYDPVAWATRFPGYALSPVATLEPDNTTPTTEIRVCAEEALTALTAAADNPAITQPVQCQSGYGAAVSSACGCGSGLEWCLPAFNGNTTFPAATFIGSRNVLLGVDDPTDQVGLNAFDWQSLWLTQEPIAFLNHMFADDRDVREMVTGRHTYVNGPMAQFYRFSARSYWTDAQTFDTPLPEPKDMPADLLPQDAFNWKMVADRGPNAAGLMTQPWFLIKNATRRARGHMAYNVFLCRDFVAPAGLALPISKEPNLMKRPGCNACHQTLEPLAASFARLVENDWSWLDPTLYPAQNASCKLTGTTIPAACNLRYDAVFSTPAFGVLRGAYADPTRADAGPAGLGKDLAGRPEFARCVAQNVAQSFLGRDLRTEDEALMQQMTGALTGGGYRARAMMKVLLRSSEYRSANNLASGVWRKGGTP